jgi:lipopolysaccharide transport system ATP-binding protein
MMAIIKVRNLSKQYRIGARKESYATLRDTIAGAVRAPLNRFRRNGQSAKNTIWALKNVSFDIKPGEVVGIIGRNGAGKSTLLKILAQITEPTTGEVEIYGRIASLLEVGTGFHPELSGRENIYLNGAILGMGKAEIARKFDEIVAFAETEKFIDTPVKRYSSGMCVRLAFAVAAHLEPEILLVDEVLAVGDVAFQKKCLGKMGDVARKGRTVLFVSHNTAAVRTLCQRAIWLGSGEVREDAAANVVMENYLHHMQDNLASDLVSSNGDFTITRARTMGQNGFEKKEFLTGETLKIELDYQCSKKFRGAYLFVAIANRETCLFAANMILDGCRIAADRERGKLSVTFKDLPLAPQQRYYLRIGGRAYDNRTPLFNASDIEVGAIQVIGAAADVNLKGEASEMVIADSTSVLVPYEWDFGNGRTHRIASFRNVKLPDAEQSAWE